MSRRIDEIPRLSGRRSPFIHPLRMSSSLTRTTLLRIALGVSVIVVLSSAVTYDLMYREIEAGAQQRLQEYSAQRAKYHESYFALAKEFEEVIGKEFLRRYQKPSPDSGRRFDRLMMRYPDGAMRNRPEFADVMRYSTGWINKDIKPDAEFKRAWMLFFDLSEEYAHMVTTRFLNLWFLGKSLDANMGYDRQDPVHPVAWAAKMAADYPAHEYEVYYMADEAHNPERATVGSAPYYEPAFEKFLVTLTTPIYVGNERVAIVGISVYLDELEASVLQSDITGASHTVFRPDGLLVASADQHPRAGQDTQGIRIADTADPRLLVLLHIATGRENGSMRQRQTTGYERQGDFYYAISYLPTPNWYFASTLPGALVRAQAFRSAQWVFWSGIASLFLLLAVLTVILRRQIARPMERLLGAVRGVGFGAAAAVDLHALENPRNEIGQLAAAFNHMVAKVSERDQALRVEKERFRALIEHAVDIIIVVDADGILRYISPSVVSTTGFSPEYYLDKSCFDTLHPEDIPTVEQALYAALQVPGAPIPRLEYRVRHRDGSWCDVEATGTNQLENPSVGGLVIIARDISEAKQAEAQIARQRETLYQQEKLAAMGSLLAGVAHELNNPLSIVVGRAIMLEEEAGNEATALTAQKIRAAAERCARIVKTFLAMARQHPPQHSRVRINRLIEDSLEILGYNLRTGGVEVVTQLAPELPEISADADQLHQVFINLLVNAQQALSDQPEPRRLRIGSGYDASTNDIWVEVADNGPGIPDAIRLRIFDPYFTTKPVGSGTGVGLAVSLGIVEAHGGRLSVSCPPEGGAVFVVRLPVHAAEAVVGEAAAPDSAGGGGKRILIVDDEPEVSALLADILASDRHRIDLAASGREALQLLAESSGYEAVLSDLRMPEMDGPALYREIERRWPDLARSVIFVTGDTLSPNVRTFLENTRCPVIEKPFIPAEVRRAIREIHPAGEPAE